MVSGTILTTLLSLVIGLGRVPAEATRTPCQNTPHWDHGATHDGQTNLNFNAWFVDPQDVVDGVVNDLVPGLDGYMTVQPGTFLRLQFWACWETDDDSLVAKVFINTGDQQNPGQTGQNPPWFDDDRVNHYPDSKRPVQVSTFFQTIPYRSGFKFTLEPILHDTQEVQWENQLNQMRFKVAQTMQGSSPPQHAKGPRTHPCDSSDPVDANAAPLFDTMLSNLHQSGNGNTVYNHDVLNPGVVVVGAVLACANKTVPARTVRQAVKFLPFATDHVLAPVIGPGLPPPVPDATNAFITVPWEDAPFNNGDITTDPLDSRRNTFFYQTVPQVVGTYLVIPRVMGTLQAESDIGPTPDAEVLAEGAPLVFCVGPPPDNPNCETPQYYQP